MADDARTPSDRRQLCGVEAISRALDEARDIQLVLRGDAELPAGARSVLERAEARGIEVRRIGERELARLADADAPPDPPLLALLGPSPATDLPGLFTRGGAVWLLVGTAYPGNAGFVIRTAEVSGASGVVIDAGFGHAERRDAYRLALRADRLLPVLFEAAEATVRAAREAGHRILAVEDVGDVAPWDVDLTPPSLFLVGGEHQGVPEALLASCDHILRLPMRGFIPSYNLQAAMAAVASERLRQLSGR